MRQTRKNKQKIFNIKHVSSKVLPGKCCNETMAQLTHWYSDCFEKYGWIVLAKSRGNTDKILAYINSLNGLKTAIEEKINKVHAKDHKADLKIMHTNISFLLERSKKDFM